MRSSRFAVLALAALSFAGCADPTTPVTTPDSPTGAYAKGGKPSPSRDPVLLEYWVIPGTTIDAPDVLHIVGEGAVAFVNPSVVYDYFFNGLRDDDPPDDAHYELLFQGPPTVPVEELANGLWHVDIPWDGRLANDDPDDKAPNHTSIEILGEGDPWVFQLMFLNAAGKSVGSSTPRGIVIDGVEGDPATIEGSDPSDPSVTIRSYATYNGSDPEGLMSISDLTGNYLGCEMVTTTSGRGKNTTTATTYQLTFHVDIAVERPLSSEETAKGVADPNQNVWWEGHFLDTGTGEISSRFVGSGARGADVTAAMPAGWTGSGNVEFVVDFVSGIGLARHIVYDPSQNDVTTTVGFGTNPWMTTTVRTGLGDGTEVPVAHTQGTAVVCQ